MKFAVVIPTYQKIDGTTPFYLRRALLSVKEQTHIDYLVYLIGDYYENNIEFIELATSIIEPDKIKYINLPRAIEREKYPLNDKRLWASGGVNATNVGIELAINDGYEYVCHLDHDDWWSPDHLSALNEYANNNNLVLATMGLNHKKKIIPKDEMNPFYPKASNLLHSATCINFKQIPLRYRDVYSEEDLIYPSDADLWNRLSKYMINNKINGFLIKKVTTYHDKEGFLKNNNE